MTVLVTGATGFIGSHLVREYSKLGEKVVAVVHDNPVWTKWLTEALSGAVLVQGDVRDFRFLMRVINQYSVDTVVHLAAQAIVKRAHRDPINTYDINVMGTVKVLEACRQLGVERILVQSSDKVYGNQMGATKNSRLLPTEPYGTSKICADMIAQSYAETYGMHVLIVRCCNVYGYDPFNSRIIPNTIKACLRGESPIIYKGHKGLRQYVYVQDVVDTMISLLELGKEGVVHIGTLDIFDQETVVKKILRFFPDIKPRYVEAPKLKEIRSQSLVPDYPEKPTPFEEGIRETILTFKKYKEDWL